MRALREVCGTRVGERADGEVMVFSRMEVNMEDGYYIMGDIGLVIKNTNVI